MSKRNRTEMSTPVPSSLPSMDKDLVVPTPRSTPGALPLHRTTFTSLPTVLVANVFSFLGLPDHAKLTRVSLVCRAASRAPHASVHKLRLEHTCTVDVAAATVERHRPHSLVLNDHRRQDWIERVVARLIVFDVNSAANPKLEPRSRSLSWPVSVSLSGLGALRTLRLSGGTSFLSLSFLPALVSFRHDNCCYSHDEVVSMQWPTGLQKLSLDIFAVGATARQGTHFHGFPRSLTSLTLWPSAWAFKLTEALSRYLESCVCLVALRLPRSVLSTSDACEIATSLCDASRIRNFTCLTIDATPVSIAALALLSSLVSLRCAVRGTREDVVAFMSLPSVRRLTSLRLNMGHVPDDPDASSNLGSNSVLAPLQQCGALTHLALEHPHNYSSWGSPTDTASPHNTDASSVPLDTVLRSLELLFVTRIWVDLPRFSNLERLHIRFYTSVDRATFPALPSLTNLFISGLGFSVAFPWSDLADLYPALTALLLVDPRDALQDFSSRGSLSSSFAPSVASEIKRVGLPTIVSGLTRCVALRFFQYRDDVMVDMGTFDALPSRIHVVSCPVT